MWTDGASAWPTTIARRISTATMVIVARAAEMTLAASTTGCVQPATRITCAANPSAALTQTVR